MKYCPLAVSKDRRRRVATLVIIVLLKRALDVCKVLFAQEIISPIYLYAPVYENDAQDKRHDRDGDE